MGARNSLGLSASKQLRRAKASVTEATRAVNHDRPASLRGLILV
jgi:hypothetical protein